MDPLGEWEQFRFLRTIAGVVAAASGIVIVGYFGLWWAMVRGVLRGWTLLHHTPIPRQALAVDVLRIGSAGVIGWGGTAFVFLGLQWLLPHHARSLVHRQPNDAD
jgi:hypothetical protein